jgi:hypothetical protein
MRWPSFYLDGTGSDRFFTVHHWLIGVSNFGVQGWTRLQADFAVRIAKTFKAIPL